MGCRSDKTKTFYDISLGSRKLSLQYIQNTSPFRWNWCVNWTCSECVYQIADHLVTVSRKWILMSYPKYPVVLPLLCLGWAVALYVAHHDGKALAGPPPVFASAAFVSQMCFCSRSTLTATSNSFGPTQRDDCPGWLLGQQGSTHFN